MPVITVEAGKLNSEQKKKLITTLSKESASIMKVSEAVITVLVKENDSENIGFAGAWLGDKKY